MVKLYWNDLYPWDWQQCGRLFYIRFPLYNKLIDFNIFKDHEPNSNHRPLIITLNIYMRSDPKEENYHFQKHPIFDKNKADVFLHDLKNELFHLSSMENIENLYHNFSTTLSFSITSSLLKSRLKQAIIEPTLSMIKSVNMREKKLSKLLNI